MVDRNGRFSCPCGRSLGTFGASEISRSWRTGVSRAGVMRNTNPPGCLADYGTTQVVLDAPWITATRHSADLNNAKVSGLPIGSGNRNPLARDEASPSEDLCVSVSESKEPAAVVTLQFTAPLFLRPKPANNVAMPVSPARAIIETLIDGEGQL